MDTSASSKIALRHFSPRTPGPDDDRALDELTSLAAVASGVSVALLGFFDENRIWFKSRYRWRLDHLSLDSPFVRRLRERSDTVVIGDVTSDADLASSPLIRKNPGIRFFAAEPLWRDSERIGGIFLFDRRPRATGSFRTEPLQSVAALVEELLESRRRVEELSAGAQRAEARAGVEEITGGIRELFDSAADLVMTMLPDGRLMHVNRALHESLGFEPSDAARMSLVDLVHPDDRAGVSEQLRELVRSNRPARIETVFLTITGRRKTFEGNLIPKVLDGETVLVRAIFRDVTERKLLEIQVGQARDAALEASRLKTRFLTNVTHEIRTPMHVIVGMLDLLLGTDLDSEQQDLVRTAQASSDELVAMITNLLHLSTLEAGGLRISVADFDLETTLRRLVDVLQVTADDRHLEITLSYDRTIPAVLRGDVARVRQVVTNLLSNAIKFSERGRIDVVARSEKETESHLLVRFEIRDSGRGIPPSLIPHLFEPFVQGDDSTTREHGGGGLGLAISQKLVDMMQGAMEVESQPGAGSTFWFTIPFRKVVSRQQAVAARKNAFAGIRILLLDRSATSRKILTHYLDSWSVRSKSVERVEEALEHLKRNVALGDPYTILMLDAHSQDASGVELALRIRADGELATTAIILLTSLGEQLNDEELRSAGVDAYLAKPVEQAELFDVLSTQVARAERRVVRDAPPVEAPLPGVPRDPSEVRVLLAEDKPLNQKLTMSQLTRLGYRVEVVPDGVEALEALERETFDVILMDCQMPRKDGYDATTEIRKREGAARRTPIIAMTAHALEGERERCLAAGMDDYLSKPTRQEDLARMLARWTSR